MSNRMMVFWEARHGLSWTNAVDACGNPDGDGLINLHEYWCQTDPQTADGSQYALSDAAHFDYITTNSALFSLTGKTM